jgi:hypothetical protein
MTGATRRISAAALALLLGAACSREPGSGPGGLVWDRDACERCGMAVSDRRFAVQVRSALDQRLHDFDELGCALLWLREEHAAQAPAELWVRDRGGEGWLDGFQARYTGGFVTPMGYGYAATGEAAGQELSLDQLRPLIEAMEDARRSSAESERR